MTSPPLPHASSASDRHLTLPVRAGLGLKTQHIPQILSEQPDIGFFEVHAENYMVAGGPFHHYLTQIRQRYALSIHGVGLSIGAEQAIDEDHLNHLAELLNRYQPHSFSEHLAWSSHGENFYNDLLPVPYDQATLARVCEHIDRIQERLQRRMLLENPSTYVEFAHSSMSETDFIRSVVERTGCGLLLDVNNVYVSCVNHNWEPQQYIDNLPLEAVGEIHLAGFVEDQDSAGSRLLIDAHGAPVDNAVWALYRDVLNRTGPLPTLIERDNDIPPLAVLLAEVQQAEALLAQHGQWLERA
ncbi:MNIO family bufferin maturase [Pseudomonas sp. RL_15y_Pfl2_60]|uniref:MNIO family bufferin maturase n=1 Tax=Pseudomonas sp. RL_15y_Pfl2_60 TaxID=3088709 RepID=UPI0030D7383F